MYKVFLTVRNRMAITTKCITALNRHSLIPHQIYVYDNLTNHKIQEHFMYWCLLYQKGLISQITFNTKESTFNAFSKAVSCNQFGLNHEMDPEKNKFDFLVFLDNDVIVSPGWDKIIKQAWDDIKKLNMNNIKVIGQLPGGIKDKKLINEKIAGFSAKIGTFGGSGFWCVKSNFFSDIGYLDVKNLIGLNKKHDQNYWTKLGKSTNGKEYILGLDTKLAYHVGSIAGSCCNVLTRNKNEKKSKVEEMIKFDNAENYIDSFTFEQFFDKIKKDNLVNNDW